MNYYSFICIIIICISIIQIILYYILFKRINWLLKNAKFNIMCNPLCVEGCVVSAVLVSPVPHNALPTLILTIITSHPAWGEWVLISMATTKYFSLCLSDWLKSPRKRKSRAYSSLASRWIQRWDHKNCPHAGNSWTQISSSVVGKGVMKDIRIRGMNIIKNKKIAES